MLKLALLATAALFLTTPAWATGDHAPPTPAPAPPTQVQGQTQGQAQGQFQGQGQQQRAMSNATGGNATGGNQTQGQTTGVNNTNNISAGNGGGNGYGQFPASSAYAPSFALSSICQEAISGGVSVFWAGASGGKVYTLDFCKMQMQADYWRKNGRDDMAKAAECKFVETRALYRETGTPCVEDAPKAAAAQTAAAPVQQVVLNAGGLQCVDAAGQPVPLGRSGAVRCR